MKVMILTIIKHPIYNILGDNLHEISKCIFSGMVVSGAAGRGKENYLKMSSAEIHPTH